ncbi:MAG: hypothetical protein LBJ95_02460 [Oscillospiraceae bacterium]|jgi:hypothetical protein|nr:hypothetical protein [Oscillospiraceae bacterium]
MAEQQAKSSQINVDINQSLSINIPNNTFISHEINHKREKFTLKTSTQPQPPHPKATSSKNYTKIPSKVRARFFPKTCPLESKISPIFPY